MPFFNWTRWLRSMYRPRGKTYYKRPGSTRRMHVEQLEDRTLLAVLPAAVVSNQTSMIAGGAVQAGTSPAIAQDPVNPLKLVEVHVATNSANIIARFSNDGGSTWS